jgi:hypothetical protein
LCEQFLRALDNLRKQLVAVVHPSFCKFPEAQKS